MTIRTHTIGALLLAVVLAAASGAAAGELISPSSVLANKGSHRGGAGFSDRTARISSIMGPELSRPAMRAVSARPGRGSATRREADAMADLR